MHLQPLCLIIQQCPMSFSNAKDAPICGIRLLELLRSLHENQCFKTRLYYLQGSRPTPAFLSRRHMDKIPTWSQFKFFWMLQTREPRLPFDLAFDFCPLEVPVDCFLAAGWSVPDAFLFLSSVLFCMSMGISKPFWSSWSAGQHKVLTPSSRTDVLGLY